MKKALIVAWIVIVILIAYMVNFSHRLHMANFYLEEVNEVLIKLSNDFYRRTNR